MKLLKISMLRVCERLGLSFAYLCISAFALGGAPLKFWAVTGSVEDVSMYRSLAGSFQNKTGIQVEVTPLAWGNFATKYFTAMAAGLPPDVGVTNLGGPFDYGSVGGLVDIRSEFPSESREIERHFDPKILGMFTLGKHLYGVPSDLSTLVLYYRTDIFEKLGLKPPKTWSEFNSTIGQLEAHNYRYYFGFTNGDQWALGVYTMPYGLSGISRNGKGEPIVNWLEPNYQKGVMEAMRLWHLHDSPGKDLQSRVIGFFSSDKPGEAIPLMADVHGVFFGIHHDAPEIDGKWAIAPWPKADDGIASNVMGGTTYVIFRKSRQKANAIKWMQYLVSDEAQQAMVLNRLKRSEDAGLAIPATKSMWSESSQDFWARPEIKKIEPLTNVVRSIFPYFSSVQSIQGSTEAGRLESNLLDQMTTFIQDRLDALATTKKMTRTELLQNFGRGNLSADRDALELEISRKLKQGYSEITPQAVKLLRDGEAHYQTRYGNIIERLPQLERQKSILDVVKAIVAAIFVIGLAIIIVHPRYRKHAISYVFVAVPISLALIYVFVPAIVALYLSFTDYHPVLPLSTAEWVGVQNYQTIAKSGDLSGGLWRTLLYATLSLPTGIVISLLLAYLLNYKLRAQRFWRFLYFSPMVTSVVSVALIFTQLFLGGKQGWLNSVLLAFHLIRDPIQFLTSEHAFLNCVITLAIWQGLAFTILVFLAGLQQVPDALYEAAEIDGASSPRKFWHVALPGIRPQLFFVSVLGLIGSFQVFEVIYTLAGKSGNAGARFGPNDSALTMVPLIYHLGFETFEMGKSASVAYVLFAIILVLTFLQVSIYKRVEATS
jgi:ABC-type sugar transport system permease subunit/ABC-type glycerol-3-phosphate transport system substrate-binding protein